MAKHNFSKIFIRSRAQLPLTNFPRHENWKFPLARENSFPLEKLIFFNCSNSVHHQSSSFSSHELFLRCLCVGEEKNWKPGCRELSKSATHFFVGRGGRWASRVATWAKNIFPLLLFDWLRESRRTGVENEHLPPSPPPHTNEKVKTLDSIFQSFSSSNSLLKLSRGMRSSSRRKSQKNKEKSFIDFLPLSCSA